MFYRVDGVEFLLDSGAEEFLEAMYPETWKKLRKYMVTDELEYFTIQDVIDLFSDL